MPAGARWVTRAACAAALAYFLFSAARSAVASTNSFPAFYTAAQLLRSGASPTQFYDDEWFAREANRYSPKIHDIWSPSPPSASALFLPLTPFSLSTARILWTAFNALLLLGTLALVLRELQLAEPLSAVVATIFLVAHPVLENFQLGQTHVLGLALSVWAWREFRRDRPLSLGLALAALALIKAGGALVILVLLLRGMWKALAAFAALALGPVLLALPWIPVAAWRVWVESTRNQAHAPWLPLPAHQSILGLLLHLGAYQPQFNPSPLFDSHRAVALAAAVLCAAVVGAVAWTAWSTRSKDEVFALALLASLVIIPVSRDYHYCVALLPIAIALWQRPAAPQLWRWVVCGCTALVALPLRHNSAHLASGLVSVLHYPLLIGSMGIIAFLAMRARAQR